MLSSLQSFCILDQQKNSQLATDAFWSERSEEFCSNDLSYGVRNEPGHPSGLEFVVKGENIICIISQ